MLTNAKMSVMNKLFKYSSFATYMHTTLFSQYTADCSCSGSENVHKIKQKIFDKINEIDNEKLFNNDIKKECYEKIYSSIKNTKEFYYIKESNTQKNYKTFFCRRNQNEPSLSLNYTDFKCMTIDELNKKEERKNSDDQIDKVIYQSRYGEFNNDSGDYGKIRPIKNDRIYLCVSDLIMFNKNYNIDKLEDVSHYLELCRYSEDLVKDQFCLDGWEVIMGFCRGHQDLNYTISFNKDNIKKLNFPEHSRQKRNIVRALLTIMNETPIELINMNNYVMLGNYDQKHDLFNQNNSAMSWAQNKVNEKKNEQPIDKSKLVIKINKLINIEELVEEIVGYFQTYSKEDVIKTKEELTDLIINKCIINDGSVLDLNKLYDKHDYVDFNIIVRRIEYLIEKRLRIDFVITKDELIKKIYENTGQYGLGCLNKKKDLTSEDFENMENNYYVSYLNGVPLKMHFNTFPIIDYKEYEKYHGNNSFNKVIEKIKKEIV
jgi:hypothetical protein